MDESHGINPERLRLMQAADEPPARNFSDRRGGRGGRGGRGRGRGGATRGRGYGRAPQEPRAPRAYSSGANGDSLQKKRIIFDDAPASNDSPIDTPTLNGTTAESQGSSKDKTDNKKKRKRDEKDLANGDDVDADNDKPKDKKKSRKSEKDKPKDKKQKKSTNDEAQSEMQSNGVAQTEVKVSKEERKAAKAARKAEKAARKAEKAEKKAKEAKKAKKAEKAEKDKKVTDEPMIDPESNSESKEEKKKRKKERKDKESKKKSKRKPETEADSSPDDGAEKKRKKQKKTVGDIESTATDKSESVTAAAAAWNASELSGGNERQSKFLRLLGAGKGAAPSNGVPVPTVDDPSNSINGKRRDKELEKQFEAGIKQKHEAGGKRRGLGA